MGDAKDRAWEAQVTRQVTAGPRPWWQRLVMPVVAQRIAPPLPEGVTPELLTRYRTEQARLTAMPARAMALLPLDIFVTSALAWDKPAPERDPRARVTKNTAPDARPALSARHADGAKGIGNHRAAQALPLFAVRGLPMPFAPDCQEVQWQQQSRDLINLEWCAMDDQMAFVLQRALLDRRTVRVAIDMRVPNMMLWAQMSRNANAVLAFGRGLMTLVEAELPLNRIYPLVTPTMRVTDVTQACWDLRLWVDDAPEMEAAA